MSEARLPPTTLALAALVAPWMAFSLLLPATHRWVALFFLLALAGLLHSAAAWSRHRAHHLGRDGDEWALATVLTLGFAMAPLALRRPDVGGMQFLCHDCGRLGDWREPFCFGCGG